MRTRLAATLLAALAGVAPTGAASPARAGPSFKARFEAGIAHYQAGRFAAAAVELEAAYSIDARPDVAFALAQATRQAGDCGRALALYRELLAADDLSDARRRAIEEAKAPCEAPVSSSGAPPRQAPAEVDPEAPSDAAPSGTAPPDEEAPPATAAAAAPVDDARPRWYGDVLGTGLVALGVAGLGVGAGGLVLARGRYDAARAAASEMAFADEVAAGDRLKRIGLGALIGGGVLATLGVLRWTLVAGREPDGGEVALAIDPRGGLIVAGEF